MPRQLEYVQLNKLKQTDEFQTRKWHSFSNFNCGTTVNRPVPYTSCTSILYLHFRLQYRRCSQHIKSPVGRGHSDMGMSIVQILRIEIRHWWFHRRGQR